jgi:hypothetical protein
MDRQPEQLVEGVIKQADPQVREVIVAFLNDGVSPSIDPSVHYDPQSQAEKFESLVDALEQVSKVGFLRDTSYLKCPECESHNVASSIACENCGVDYEEMDQIPRKEWLFEKPNFNPSRDVRWFILIHGMNSVGDWQQEFSWRIQNIYGYAVPTSIFKYGVVRIGAIFGLRITKLSFEFENNLERIFSEIDVKKYGYPDVIAHSLGTRILREVIDRRNKSIKFGRIILCGSIIRQDYNWSENTGIMFEKVLNHIGSKDRWARISKFFIPGSGPSGAYGFIDKSVINVIEEGCGHTGFFTLENIQKFVGERGVWRLYLTSPDFKAEVRSFKPSSLDYHDGGAWANIIRNISRFIILVIMVFVCVYITIGTIVSISILLNNLSWINMYI